MNHIAEDILMHYGVSKLDGAPGRGSGRYPLGSGDDPYQRAGDFKARVTKLKKGGMTEKEIADYFDVSTTKLRALYRMDKDEERAEKVAAVRRLHNQGLTPTEIAKKLGYKNESSVRSLLNEDAERRMNSAQVQASYLKKIVDEKGMIDVGAGVERELGISSERMKEALELLKLEGYEVYGRGVPQVTNPGKQTNIMVLCPPGTQHKDIYDTSKIHSVKDYEQMLTENGEKIRPSFVYPESLDPKRLKIIYAEDGGTDKDGLVEIRRGVKDLSLGESNYAQVRILVDGTHYIKGMAVYNDNMPDGVDVLFNTNKSKGTPMLGEDKNHTVLKPISDDPKNPFGSLIKEHGGQSYYDDPKGNYIDPATGKKQSLSLINKRADEGDWGEWADRLPSQFLAKQNKDLINRQLNLALADRKAEYDEIISYTNPTIKRTLLYKYAESCDKAAEHLQAAALPRQKYQVILPLKTIKDNEIFAPNYINGETVALIRYPHGGTFEIPILKVNNKQQEGIDYITKNAKDAVGINAKVAARLSGADFDGDTVMVIPVNSKIKITSTRPLKGLEGFDPKLYYGPESTDKPYKRMSKGATQRQMGEISNLITDMTLKGASPDELARAVRHSMVVIDAAKHNLDYKRSYIENGIPQLKREYQGRIENGKYTEGASTLISRAKAQTSVVKRQGSPMINQKGKAWYDPTKPEGAIIFKEAPNATYTYTDAKGNIKTGTRMQKSTQMAETTDARKLSTGTIPEEAYANYANQLKSLANNARKEMITTGRAPYNAQAAKVYKKEVDSINAQLQISLKNAPRERMAQLMSNTIVEAKKADNPDMTKKEIKKAGQLALTEAREKVGAKRTPIVFSDKEWEAVQAGAISDHKMTEILKYADSNELKKRALPKTTTQLSAAKQSKIRAMKASGYTNREIADSLGISPSTVTKYI